MKRVLLMVTLSLFPRLLVAQDLDISSLIGEDWYGLYFNGQKAGWASNAVEFDPEGNVLVSEDAHFRVTMNGVKQDMQIAVKRIYAKNGDLLRIEQTVSDQGGVNKIDARVHDDTMTMTSEIGGAVKTHDLPKPKESLRDALKQVALVSKNPKVGDTMSFSTFEPMYERELNGVSTIEGVEERVLDGVATKVYKVKTTIKETPIDTISYVAEGGKTLEDQLAGIITTRLEPKEMAQDVNYSNDVIVSNAALVDQPIGQPRTRDTLHLRITGPLAAEHFLNDDRQHLAQVDGHVDFVGKRISLDGFATAHLPIDNADVLQWTKPSMLVQSEDPKLVAKAREIVGDEKDTFAISTLLCHWVNANVRTTFSARLTNALEVLEHPEGDCTEHSMLFIGLARAAGLPAREAAGLIYVADGKPGFYFHQWATVWVGKWIDVDPTFDQPIADATHIKLAEGDLFEQAKLIPTIGQLKIQVVDEAEKEKP